MYQIVLDVIGRLLFYSGMFSIFSRLAKKHYLVLVYHDPKLARIESHVGFLQDHTDVCSFSDKLLTLQDQIGSKNRLGVFLTFDDGYPEYTKIAKYLENNNVIAIMFISTGVVNSKKTFWWQVEHEGFNPNLLKEIPDSQRLKKLRGEYAWSDLTEVEGRKNLTDSDLSLLLNYNMLLGGHTVTHPVLSRCEDEKASEEIVRGVRYLREKIGAEVEYFAYPNGRPIDFGIREKSILRANGVKFARTTTWGLQRFDHSDVEDFLEHPGVIVFDNASVFELVSRMMGVDHFVKHINAIRLKYTTP